jgi:predicted nucleic acid-binding protein
MREILIDTSALFALADADDLSHVEVTSWLMNSAQNSRLVLTDYVFDECMTLMKSRFGAEAAISFGQRIRSSQFCRFVQLTPQDEAATWQIFAQYADKDWSYTDCSCLAVMRRLGIRIAFATDRHFRQMGVRVVP